MTIAEYIARLTLEKESAIARFRDLSAIEREVYNESFSWLLDNLNIKRGTIETDETLTRAMDSFLYAVVDILNSNKKFTGTVGSFLTDLSTIQANNRKFHATTNNFNIQTAGVTDIQKVVVDEIMNQFLNNGLNQNFAAPLRDNIFRNILAGASMADIKQVLQTYIISGQDESGKLQQYLHNTAIQAADAYTGAINQKLVEEFDFTGFIISGSLIATSSKQCIYAIETGAEGYHSFKEWNKILIMAAMNKQAPLIPGTTIKNLPLNKLHWGCRHDFTPVIMPGDEKPKEEPKKEEKPEGKPKTNLQVLKPIETKIRQQDFESAAVSKDGKLSFFKDGEAAKVEFTSEEVKMMRGAVLTHNHPSSRSFSRADVELFIDTRAERLRAVARLADYDLQRTAKTTVTDWREGTRIYNQANWEIQNELTLLIDTDQMTIDEANAIHHHKVMEIVAKKLNFKYEKKTRK